MKNQFYIALLFCSGMLWAQEDGMAEKKDSCSNIFPYIKVERFPVFNKCSPKLNNIEQRTCTSKGISKIVERNFNFNLPNKLKLPEGIVRIYVVFNINCKGEVTDIYARAPHPALEAEAIRVFNLVPKFDRPGFHFGEPRIVRYSTPLIIKVEARNKIESNNKTPNFRQF